MFWEICVVYQDETDVKIGLGYHNYNGFLQFSTHSCGSWQALVREFGKDIIQSKKVKVVW